MKILLTGSNGFIGSQFITLFSNKYEITGLDNNYFCDDENYENISFIKKDIRNINSSDLENIDVVVHMAELCNDPLSDLNPKLTVDINVNATQKLIKLCDEAGVKKMIYMSSCSVYGKSKDEVVNEKSEVDGLTEYAKAKISNENFINDNDFQNLEIIMLRNATVYGYSNNIRLDLVVNNLTYFGLKNNFIELYSDGSPLRPLVHVSDLCNVIDYFIKSNKNWHKETFNVGSNNQNYSIRDIAISVSKNLNIDDLKFNYENKDQRSYKVNFDKLKTATNFEPNYDLDRGIKELVNKIDLDKPYKNALRLKKINQLIVEGKIDLNLNWIN